MNDEKIGGFGRLNGGIGYRFDKIGFANQPELKLNLFNILNAKGLTGVSGIQNNAQKVILASGASVSGSAPTYYIGQGFAALLSFKVGF